MDNSNSFLGKGWKFPPSFTKGYGGVEMVSAQEDIKESLFILLSTRPGERIMNPEFGCDLYFAMYENINLTITNKIKAEVERAVGDFEHRITLDEVQVDTEQIYDGLLSIVLFYTINETNTPGNMVFPFYLEV